MSNTIHSLFFLFVVLSLALFGWWRLWSEYLSPPFETWLRRVLYRLLCWWEGITP